jgi:polysaccharide deacetylase 2 family uncharacterized protein YibQ
MPARRRPPDPEPGRRPTRGAESWAGPLSWTVFLLGALALAWVVLQPLTPRSRDRRGSHALGSRPTPAAGEAPGRRKPRPTDLLRRGAPPRIAIIIDDVGQDLAAVERLTRMPYDLTLAVIPHLPHSKRAAELANQRGYEVMLHLPMEPLDYPKDDPGPGAVTTRMHLDEVRRTVLLDLAAVPHVRGINNHMGSRLTADPERMRAVLETIATTPCFFVDSRTSAASVAYRLARELRIPAAERSVFLDDTVEPQAVRAELRRLTEIARARGQAIAIGHPHAVTLDVLTEHLPEVLDAGIEVVFVSELVS